MPSRSSRSRPASRTSWSDPTGPASLAIAIARNLAIPLVGVAHLPQPLPRLVVAEGAGDPRFVRSARREAELGGGFVVAGEVGLEHGGIIGRDRAADAGGDQLRERVLLERRDGAGAEV